MTLEISTSLIIPSRLEKISTRFLNNIDVSLFVKRDDLIHPHLSGNKYRKLKYNLQYIKENKLNGFITFGGAYSNHIFSVAAAGSIHQTPTIGIIRGEELNKNSNATLKFANDCGMQLHFIPRSEYRLKEDSEIVKEIIAQYPDYHLIPEGGSNALAVKGASEIIDELKEQIDNVDYIIVPSGTGGTAAGILQGILENNLSTKLLAFSSLKGDFLENEISNLARVKSEQLEVITDYHFGGYAKSNAELKEFIKSFYSETGIITDEIYNGKTMYGFFDMIKNSYFRPDTSIVWVNTGGLRPINT